MMNPTDLKVRHLEHLRRVEQANRNGWLHTSARDDLRTPRFGALLGFLGARARRHGLRPDEGTSATEVILSLVSASQKRLA
jgi:hypothetical protein